MALAWCLPTGFDTPVTYFYVIYFAVLLIHRQRRDDEKCEKKYALFFDLLMNADHIDYVGMGRIGTGTRSSFLTALFPMSINWRLFVVLATKSFTVDYDYYAMQNFHWLRITEGPPAPVHPTTL